MYNIKFSHWACVLKSKKYHILSGKFKYESSTFLFVINVSLKCIAVAVIYIFGLCEGEVDWSRRENVSYKCIMGLHFSV